MDRPRVERFGKLKEGRRGPLNVDSFCGIRCRLGATLAQWAGQFSGHTHATRVEEIEASLRHAVTAVTQAAGTGAAVAKAKAVRHLANRLLAARRRIIRARRAAELPLTTEQMQSRPSVSALPAREADLKAKGVAGILAEFGVPDLPP